MITFKEVDAARYDEMLNILPPAEHRANAFLVGEAWTHRQCTVYGRWAGAFMALCRADQRYWESEQPVTQGEFRSTEFRPELWRYVEGSLTWEVGP